MISILLLILSALIYQFFKNRYQYWQKRGVPGPTPKFLVGNLGRAFLMKRCPSLIYTDIYQQFDDSPIVGVYRAVTPVLIIRDPELIREVTTKSFNHFTDNDFNIDKDSDPLVGKNPFFQRGEEWRATRNKLTPAFTSGKMKLVYPHMLENAAEMVQFLHNNSCYEAKELFTRYTLNNVASCAFGLEGRCFVEDLSQFRKIARDFFSPGGWTLTMLYLISLFPSLSRIQPLRLTPKHVEAELIEIVSQTLRYRQENNIVRNDFLQIMADLRETCGFTELDVAAQAAGFFVDGYETSSTVMSFLLFLLARDLEVQERLREEIRELFPQNEELDYEKIQSLQYLDAVVNESIRVYPTFYTLHKLCTEPYTYTPKDGEPVTIEKDTMVVLPTYGLQHDPKYFEDPEAFKPERFLGKNKEKIKKFTFMPFGEGPRSCLGQRFGLLQIKVGVVYLIKNYVLGINSRTKLPLQIDPASVFPVPVGGIWIDFQKI